MKAEEFDKLHGNYIISEGWLYFEDGCRRERNAMGARITPNDPYRKAQCVVYYWRVKLDLAVQEFQLFKRNLLAITKASVGQRHCAPAPDDGAVNRLEELKVKVQGIKVKLEEAEELMEEARPEIEKRRERMDAEMREQNQNVAAKISTIEI